MDTDTTRLLSMKTYKAGLMQARAYRNIGEFMDKQLAAHGLSMPEWSFLGLVCDQGSQSLKQLADQLDVTAPFATRLSRSLAEKGLVGMESSTSDGRTRCVAATPHGKKVIDGVEKSLRQNMKQLLVDIDMDDLEIYLQVLCKLADMN